MKKSIGLFFILTLISCSTNNNINNVVGNYVSQKGGNKIKVAFDYYISNKIYVRDSIDVNKDSTFYFESCSQNMKGYWKVSNDSLLLFAKSNRFRIDSLNYSKRYSKDTVCSKEPMVWIIKGDKLRVNLFKSNGKKVYYILEKQ